MIIGLRFGTLSIVTRERFSGPGGSLVRSHDIVGPSAPRDIGKVSSARKLMFGDQVFAQSSWTRPSAATPQTYLALMQALSGSGLLRLPESAPQTGLPLPGFARIMIDNRTWLAPLDALPPEFTALFRAVNTYKDGLASSTPADDAPLPTTFASLAATG